MLENFEEESSQALSLEQAKELLEYGFEEEVKTSESLLDNTQKEEPTLFDSMK
ncbi:hypothetical protein [Helicobacter cetorum]|uniref:hypothetical protein n=1 Tax=Helicobacter cetorum TaxID=138563 RepID=UPI0002E9FDFD|nr:hypothetical protein [Helicobacter cetorum]